MARTKRGVVSKAKHKKVLKAVKGQYGRRKNTIRIARQAMEKAMQYAYRDRKAKKREFRSLWIVPHSINLILENLRTKGSIKRALVVVHKDTAGAENFYKRLGFSVIDNASPKNLFEAWFKYLLP
jgi:ribosomal protein L20